MIVVPICSPESGLPGRVLTLNDGCAKGHLQQYTSNFQLQYLAALTTSLLHYTCRFADPILPANQLLVLIDLLHVGCIPFSLYQVLACLFHPLFERFFRRFPGLQTAMHLLIFLDMYRINAELHQRKNLNQCLCNDLRRCILLTATLRGQLNSCYLHVIARNVVAITEQRTVPIFAFKGLCTWVAPYNLFCRSNGDIFVSHLNIKAQIQSRYSNGKQD